MNKIVWSQIFETGIDTIDVQHQLLIDLINKASHLLRQEHSLENLQSIVNDMIRYTQYHFETEENLMHTHEYAIHMPKDYEMHIEEHCKFSTQVLDIHTQIREGTTIEREEIVNFLCEWLIDHIHHTDKKLGKFLENSMNDK